MFRVIVRLDYVEFSFYGPGGTYGFGEKSEPKGEPRITSIVLVANHEICFPFRITRAFILGNIILLGGAALYWYRRRNGKRPAHTAS